MNSETLAQLGITKEDIIQRVVYSISEGIEDLIIGDIRKRVLEDVSTKISTVVNDVINETASKAFDSEYTPINTWGEPVGQPTTLRQAFLARAKEWWSTKVNSNGQPDKSYGAKRTMAQYHAEVALKDILDRTMRESMQEVINDAKSQLGAAITKHLSAYVATKLS